VAIAFPPIPASTPAVALSQPSAAPGAAKAAGGFGESLDRLTRTVDASTGAANTAVSKMIDGSGDVHEAMIALQQAEMTLELTVQMRNKFVQAYQDIMKMPV
jgi:flagellar hook-basal body complex protein FliE